MKKLSEDRKTYCCYLPRVATSTADAIYDAKWKITKSRRMHELLNEMHECRIGHFALEIYSYLQTIHLCYTAVGATANIIAGMLYAIFPDAEIREIEDFTSNISDKDLIATTEVKLGNPDIFPTNTYKDTYCDPLEPPVNAISQIPSNLKVIVQFATQNRLDTTPFHFWLWLQRNIDRIRHIFRAKYWFKKGVRDLLVEKMLEKTTGKMYLLNFRIAVIDPANDNDEAFKASKEELASYVDQIFSGFTVLNHPDVNWFERGPIRFGLRYFKDIQVRALRNPFIVSTKELSSLWHLPNIGGLPNIAMVLSKRYGPPRDLPVDKEDAEISFFAETIYREQHIPFGIYDEDRRRHMYVLGTSGTGKSKLIELLIAQDMQKGHGAAVLDPHGDLVENVLKLVPKHRVEDVIVFDPSDTSYPPSLNPFELVEEDGRMRVAAGLIEIFKLRFAHEWSERLEHLLRYTILALLSTQWTTVLSIKKMLLDESYRAAVIANVKDRVVKDFWEREFPEWYAKYYDSVILPLLSQVNDFAGSPMLHNSLGQPFNKFDFRKIMDARKILLMKVSKRLLGEDNAALLGSMIITRIYQAAMSRANVPFEERPDFFFYVDEFNEFATASFEEILSESRKYRLNLTITNQFLDQLPAPIRKTIFGNVGNIVAFKTSTEDSSVLSGELHPRVDASDLVNLAPREFFIKMSIKGQSHEPFSGRTLSVEYPEKNFATECIENSRAQYCLPKEQAEEIISTWADVG